MLHNARTSLTEAVVMDPGRAILFYGRCSLGEGLTLDEARNAAFLLTGVGMWVGEPACLAADHMTIQGQWVIAQAPRKDTPRDISPNHQLLPYWHLRGWDCNRHWRDHR